MKKRLAQRLLDMLKPGESNYLRDALWMYVHDNKVRS